MSKRSMFLGGLLALPLLAASAHAQPVNMNAAPNNANLPFPYMTVQHLPNQDCQQLAAKVNADIRRVRHYVFHGADWFDSDTWGLENRLSQMQAEQSPWSEEDNAFSPRTLLDRDIAAAKESGCVSEKDTTQAVDSWLERVKQVVPNPASTREEIRATKKGVPVVAYIDRQPASR